MTFLYTLLASLGATFKELLLELGESMGLVSEESRLVKDVAAGIGALVDQQLVEVLHWLDLRLRDVEQWARELCVHLDVHLLERVLEEREVARKAADIR